MDKKITALEPQKRNNDRINVYLDGEFAFGLDMLTAVRLKIGQILSAADIAQLQQTDGIAQAYERAIRFLGTRPRSITEIRRKLREKDIPSEIIDIVIERLETMGYVNDLEFARLWVKNRQEFNPRGTMALRFELRAKGVSDAVIDETLADFDAMPAALAAARSKLRSLRRTDERTFRQKMGNFLVRRGFGYETARDVTDMLLQERQAEYDTDDSIEE